MIDFIRECSLGIVVLGATAYIAIITYWTLHREK